MTKHTPGPWELDTCWWPLIVNGPDDAKGRNFVCGIEKYDATGNEGGANCYEAETALANAHLIAAAPELLEALEAAVAALNQIPNRPLTGEHANSYEVAALCDKALAKAKGG